MCPAPEPGAEAPDEATAEPSPECAADQAAEQSGESERDSASQQAAEQPSSSPPKPRRRRRATLPAPEGTDPEPYDPPSAPRSTTENDDRLRADKPPHWG